MIDPFPFVRPFLYTLNPERAHALVIKGLKMGLIPPPPSFESPRLQVKLWGLTFPGPVGLAAGFDKNAEAFNPLIKQGFDFVEVGSLTPAAQTGNPKPRLFRLKQDHALINHMGFNNQGHEAAVRYLQQPKSGIVGINLGRNKTSTSDIEDYTLGIDRLASYADYLVINVSSPNTPGLRASQSRQKLERLMTDIRKVLPVWQEGVKTPPLLLKIAPDLSDQEREDIADVAINFNLGGLIVSNTTINRPGWLKEKHSLYKGGLSGKPLFDLSTREISKMYRLTKGKIPLIGVGGICNGEDAYIKICAGASLIQLYSALVFQGFGLVARIQKKLEALLVKEGFKTIGEAVGSKEYPDT